MGTPKIGNDYTSSELYSPRSGPPSLLSMRIRQINFPSKLLEAQKSGRLVIFAGAGVSVDPPSSYPDFRALASKVGGTQYPRRDDENIDAYLGRLEANGITVHKQVQQILSSPDSVPNENHKAIVGIFKDQHTFRLVTTNFDRHFITAAVNRFKRENFDIFDAPALPVGNDFTGIVNLHGSVDRHPHWMVLTDRDFGRAYITEAWATRFLERLFSRFVVLFVGYRHEDMLLSYFARALSGNVGIERFVLTPPDRDRKWESLGITPVHYPLSTPPDLKHGQLTVGLGAWMDECQSGLLAVEARIRNILGKELPESGSEDEDYLKNALLEVPTLRFFTRHAHGVHWLEWVEAQPTFQRIFVNRSDYAEMDRLLAAWFVGEFAINQINKALDVIRRRGRGLSPLLWQEIALVLFRAKVHGQVLSTWVTVLVSSAVSKDQHQILEYVLSHCAYPEDEVSALLLFEYLTHPRIELKESYKPTGDEDGMAIKAEIEYDGSEYWLRQGWSNVFAPNLTTLAKKVAPIVSSNLIYAHRLSVGFERDLSFDALSFSRGMVESREQDHLRDGFSVLIDAGAATIRSAAEYEPELADALIVSWFSSESLILQRLAIFGLALSAHIAGGEKLKWVIKNNLVGKFGYKHELFLLLEKAYPEALSEERAQFIKEVEGQHKADSKNPEIAQYELFNLVGWLLKSCPSCEITSAFLARLKKENPTFTERDHPDMDSWIGPVSSIQWESPGNSTDLLSYDLPNLLEELKTLREDFYPGVRSRESLIHQITQCAQGTHEWGIDIAKQATQESIWVREIWEPLLVAWAGTQMAEADWAAVLDILSGAIPVYKTTMHSLARLLEHGARGDATPIPTTLLPLAKEIADNLWNQIEENEENEIAGDIDWLGRAINHPAGVLFEFYFHSLFRLQKDKTTKLKLDDYKSIFNSALIGDGRAAQLARVVLASQLHFLYVLDKDWTIRKAFAILDAKVDERRAKQCWHGFLYWGHWSDPMLVNLLDSYEAMFPFVDTESNEIRRMFCGHLSGIAIHSSIDPLEHGWLSRFLTKVTPATRALWAGEFRNVMGAISEESKISLWRRWLRKYWEERLQGRPLKLEGKEVTEMIGWSIDLGPVFPEAVELIRESPNPEFGNSMIYYRLSESELLKQHPDSFADLLAFLTSKEGTRPIYDLEQLYKAVELLVELEPRNPRLRTLCDDLARLGATGVSVLATKLDPPYLLN
jgi:hypothetical protein